MAKYRVQIPHLVWYEVEVEAKNPRDAFKKAYSGDREGMYEADYDHEELSPEQIEWHVHEDDFDEEEPVCFCKTPRKG